MEAESLADPTDQYVAIETNYPHKADQLQTIANNSVLRRNITES